MTLPERKMKFPSLQLVRRDQKISWFVVPSSRSRKKAEHNGDIHSGILQINQFYLIGSFSDVFADSTVSNHEQTHTI